MAEGAGNPRGAKLYFTRRRSFLFKGVCGSFGLVFVDGRVEEAADRITRPFKAGLSKNDWLGERPGWRCCVNTPKIE